MLIYHTGKSIVMVGSSGGDDCKVWKVTLWCCIPSETNGRNGVTQIFRSFHRTARSTINGWSHWNILMCFLYIILSTTFSFLDLTDVILFLQGLLCGVCGKGVQANSVQCTVCIKWIHKRRSGVHGDLSLVADGFRCMLCDGTIQEADLAGELVEWIFIPATGRIRNGWMKFQELFHFWHPELPH